MTAGDRGKRGSDAHLVAALAAGASVPAAARAGGVSEATVYRRLREPAFRRQVDEARAEMLGRALARLSATCSRAATTLADLLAAESESVRLGAARSILDVALRWREQDELARRLDNIESWIEVLDAKADTGGMTAWRRRG